MSRRNFSASPLPIVTLARSGKSGCKETIKCGGMNSIPSLDMSIFPAFARWNIHATWIGLSRYWMKAKFLSRNYIGIDIAEEYAEIAKRRLAAIPQVMF